MHILESHVTIVTCEIVVGCSKWVLEDVVVTRRTDRRTCPLGVCSYVLETLDVVNLARNYRKDQRIRTGECTSIFGFGSYPPKFSYDIPSKFHQRFPPIFVSSATKFPSFISLRHKISESSDINQDVR